MRIDLNKLRRAGYHVQLDGDVIHVHGDQPFHWAKEFFQHVTDNLGEREGEVFAERVMEDLEAQVIFQTLRDR